MKNQKWTRQDIELAVEMRRRGMQVRDIALALGKPEGTTRQYLRREGAVIQDYRRTDGNELESIREFVRSNPHLTNAEIARHFGRSTGSMRHIIRRYKLTDQPRKIRRSDPTPTPEQLVRRAVSRIAKAIAASVRLEAKKERALRAQSPHATHPNQTHRHRATHRQPLQNRKANAWTDPCSNRSNHCPVAVEPREETLRKIQEFIETRGITKPQMTIEEEIVLWFRRRGDFIVKHPTNPGTWIRNNRQAMTLQQMIAMKESRTKSTARKT